MLAGGPANLFLNLKPKRALRNTFQLQFKQGLRTTFPSREEPAAASVDMSAYPNIMHPRTLFACKAGRRCFLHSEVLSGEQVLSHTTSSVCYMSSRFTAATQTSACEQSGVAITGLLRDWAPADHVTPKLRVLSIDCKSGDK